MPIGPSLLNESRVLSDAWTAPTPGGLSLLYSRCGLLGRLALDTQQLYMPLGASLALLISS